MKFLFSIFLLISFNAKAELNINEAYQREKSYLLAQKEALLKMKSSLVNSQNLRKSKAELDIVKKQNELSAFILKNQELHEEFKVVEKSTKESAQLAGQLEKNGLKITDSLNAIKTKLGLPQTQHAEMDSVKRFENILEDVFGLIGNMSNQSWRPHAFLDENDHLVQGEVLFNGLFSAFGKTSGKIYHLVPYNNEFLKASGTFSGNEVHLFSPNFERTGFKTAKTWKESVADALPGVIMVMIMICVLGLFIMLARS